MQLAQAEQMPISSHGGVRPRTYGLIHHIQVGNGSLYGYFGNSANNVSSHFWVRKDGYIEQYIDTSLIAWTQADGNSSWISAECEGFVDEPLTEAQLNSMAVLLYLTSGAYDFPIQTTDDVNGRGLGYHQMGGVAWGNHSCPGPTRIAQNPEIVRRARSITNGGLTSEPLGDDDMPLNQADIEAIWNYGIKHLDGTPVPAQVWLRDTRLVAGQALDAAKDDPWMHTMPGSSDGSYAGAPAYIFLTDTRRLLDKVLELLTTSNNVDQATLDKISKLQAGTAIADPKAVADALATALKGQLGSLTAEAKADLVKAINDDAAQRLSA